MDGVWVVKIGGSLFASRRLRGWLSDLAGIAGPIVVVPGGGPFADQVRVAQRRWRFDDATAHRMAILAMDQYGLMLADLHPAAQPADSRAAIRAAWRAGRLPIWLPSRLTVGRRDIPMSWNVTSDSLAAWLAAALGAAHLLLVKSAVVPAGRIAASRAVRAGIIDSYFPQALRRARCRCWCVHAGGAARTAAAIAAGTPLPAEIVLSTPGPGRRRSSG